MTRLKHLGSHVLQKMRAIKRSKTRDKREQAHREALRAVQHSEAKEAPRTAAGRIPGAFAGDSISKAYQVSHQCTSGINLRVWMLNDIC